MIKAASKKDFIFISCIVLLSLWGLQTFFRSGLFETHDGRLHVSRLFWFDEEIRSGQFPVRWSETANHQYGYPLFTFYYPAFYLLAEATHIMGFSFVDSIKVLVAGSFLLSGVAAYYWLKTFSGKWPALAGAMVFLLAPYRLELLFVMGRWAESFSFLPLILVLWAVSRKRLLLGGLFLALLILSHNAVVLLTMPIILIWGILSHRCHSEAAFGGRRIPLEFVVWGLALSAWFWIPALAESRYTLQGQKPVYDFRQNFPSFKSYLYYPWGYGFSLTGEPNGVSPMVGLGQLAAIVLGAAVFILVIPAKAGIYNDRFRVKPGMTRILVFGLIGTGTAFFMMNSVSIPIWEKLPLIKAIQFPGRLQVVLLTMIAMVAAAALEVLTRNGFQGLTFAKAKVRPLVVSLVAIFLVGLTVYANRNYLRAGVPDRFFDQDVTGAYWFRFGTGDSSHESTPIWSRPLPPEWEQKIEVVTGDVEISQVEIRPRRYRFTAGVKGLDGIIKVNTVYYPGWRVRIDDREIKLKIPTEENNPYGLIKFTVPEGKHQIGVSLTETPLRLFSDLVSATSLLALVKAWPFGKRPGLF